MRLAVLAGVVLACPVPAALAAACGGDCDRNCSVTVDEVLTMVNVALGQSPVFECGAGDADADEAITVDEILGGLVHALEGCAGASCESRCRVPAGAGVNFDPEGEPCEFLSSYRFFKGNGTAQLANERVLPYDLNTQLFSDFTAKHRFVYIPAGPAAEYDSFASFDFPIGTVLIKTFAYPFDLRDPSAGEDLIETRLLIRRAAGWVALPYVWNDDESDAVLRLIGKRVTVSGIDHDGVGRSYEYSVPNANQCKECHEEQEDVVSPLGPKARNLNKEYRYADGAENQLLRWSRAGILRGAPADPEQAPRAAVLEDPDSGTVEQRARTYLDVNCSHCHNPGGAARTTGLYFHIQNDDAYSLGVCKQPTAAGQGTGGFARVIDPGRPETSIIPFRMGSTQTGIAMPELGRRRTHDEAVALIEQWIAGVGGTCGDE
ncbi:MAG TPA: SO2930 family diheme c-type cytochrome [Terriglobales bacterium]|nr:SO2930 family diheme c-type cytochrome [Terriglobales bacterium]